MKFTRKICDSLKKYETSDIWIELGAFQADIVSIEFHFLSSIKAMNASLSREPRYCRNSPLSTLQKKIQINYYLGICEFELKIILLRYYIFFKKKILIYKEKNSLMNLKEEDASG